MELRESYLTWALCCGLLVVAGCGAEDDSASQAGEDPILDINWPADTEATPPVADTQLKLKVGQRFPLRKIVSQTLTQFVSGQQTQSQSRLELMLEVRVQDVQTERTKMQVRYLAVRYSQTINGQATLYDSRATNPVVPPEAQMYSGLINNGFAFWIGSNHQIGELEGFDGFLSRCVDGIPNGQRQHAIAILAAQVGESKIANFIDDSIGLLPENGEPQVGQKWQKTRHVLQPLPIQLNMTCALDRLNKDDLEVSIVGHIQPNVSQSLNHQVTPGIRLTVEKGHTLGSCRISRTTGLPIHSQQTMELDFLVHIPDGGQFRQHKQIVTEISTYEQNAAPIQLAKPTAASR